MSTKILKCYFCGEPVEQKDFCHGCSAYICQECGDTYPETPGGKHNPVAHIKLKAAMVERSKAQIKIDEIVNKE